MHALNVIRKTQEFEMVTRKVLLVDSSSSNKFCPWGITYICIYNIFECVPTLARERKNCKSSVSGKWNASWPEMGASRVVSVKNNTPNKFAVIGPHVTGKMLLLFLINVFFLSPFFTGLSRHNWRSVSRRSQLAFYPLCADRILMKDMCGVIFLICFIFKKFHNPVVSLFIVASMVCELK